MIALCIPHDTKVVVLLFFEAAMRLCSQSLVAAIGSGDAAVDKASLLAKNVYEGVRQRMHQLQADVQDRDKHAAVLQSKLETLAQQHKSALQQMQLEQQVGLL